MIWFLIIILLVIILLAWSLSRPSGPSTAHPRISFTSNSDSFDRYSQHQSIEQLRQELTETNNKRGEHFNQKYGKGGEELKTYFANNVRIIAEYILNPSDELRRQWTLNNHRLGLFLQEFKKINLAEFESDFDTRFKYLVAKAKNEPYDKLIAKQNQDKLNAYFD